MHQLILTVGELGTINLRLLDGGCVDSGYDGADQNRHARHPTNAEEARVHERSW